MLKILEKHFGVKVERVKKDDNYNFIYETKNNLEMLISRSSLEKDFIKVQLLCGKLNEKVEYYKINFASMPDIVIAGNVKVRLLFFKEAKVITMSKSGLDDSAIFDANIRQKYDSLPAPKVYDISKSGVVTEELIINENRKDYLLSHPIDTIDALLSMKAIYCQFAHEKDKKFYSVIHGQLYKSDHILKDKRGKIYIVDWSEGGDKDNNAYGRIYFDIVSSIKWVLFSRRFKLYYYFKYIDAFIGIAYTLSKEVSIVDWKSEFIEMIESLCEPKNSFNKDSILVKNLKHKVAQYDDE
jgi:hypothetical protein